MVIMVRPVPPGRFRLLMESVYESPLRAREDPRLQESVHAEPWPKSLVSWPPRGEPWPLSLSLWPGSARFSKASPEALQPAFAGQPVARLAVVGWASSRFAAVAEQPQTATASIPEL